MGGKLTAAASKISYIPQNLHIYGICSGTVYISYLYNAFRSLQYSHKIDIWINLIYTSQKIYRMLSKED